VDTACHRAEGGPKYLVDSSPGSAPAQLRRASDWLSWRVPPRRTLAGHPDDGHPAVGDLEVLLAHSKCSAARRRIFLRTARPARRRRPRHHRAAARKGAGAPIELVGVAGDDVDIADIDADPIGGDLAKTVKCPAPCVPMPVATLTLPLACT
jgi:hypothetical protein